MRDDNIGVQFVTLSRNERLNWRDQYGLFEFFWRFPVEAKYTRTAVAARLIETGCGA